MSEKMQNESTDPTWKMHMETLMKRQKRIEIAEVIDEAIWRWYFEHGKEVPNWKMKKDPQWWTDYLAELDNLE
jgi:hypothetical protein